MVYYVPSSKGGLMKDTKRVAENRIYIIDGVICTKCVWEVGGKYGNYKVMGRYWNPISGGIDECRGAEMKRNVKKAQAEKVCKNFAEMFKWESWHSATLAKIKERAAEDGRRVTIVIKCKKGDRT